MATDPHIAKTLENRFLQSMQDLGIKPDNNRLILACSGGLDSCVLFRLLVKNGFRVEIAHANFRLRGRESDEDEQFVGRMAAASGLPFHTRSFDAKDYAEREKCSIQVAARQLRYDWFDELIRSGLGASATHDKKTWLLTAHHQDDNVETTILNFFRGTGITGLRGMLPVSGYVVRPLLFATRKTLEAYANAERLEWRDDSSNLSDTYTRNFIRHQVIPLVESRFPKVSERISQHIEQFREVELIYRAAVSKILAKLVEHKNGEQWVPVHKLRQQVAPATLLYEWLAPFGCSPAQAAGAMNLLESETGRYMEWDRYRLLRNRNWLVLSSLEVGLPTHFVIDELPASIQFPGGELDLQFISPEEAEHQLAKGSMVLDAALLQCPMILRKWKQGDYFYPSGMKHKKKIARFLIDQKLSKNDKEQVWVLESDQRIPCVLGYRVDDRFTVRSGTRKAVLCRVRT